MPFEGESRIRLRHALPIIDDLYGSPSGIHHHDMDGLGTGIDRIFHQFLDDGSWSLNDFASGNLVGDGIGEELDDIGHLFKLEMRN